MAKYPTSYVGPESPLGKTVAEAKRDRERYQREASEVRRMYPEVGLQVYAIPLGVKVELCLYYAPEPGVPRVVRMVKEALFQPPEVTEELMVDWGRRAMEAWLREQAEAAIEAAKE